MQDVESMVRTKEDAVTELIGMLRRYDLPDDQIALIQGMLVGNADDAATENALRRGFDDMLEYNPEPSAETRRRLAEVKARLGMEPVRKPRRSLLRAWPARVAVAAVVALLVAGGALLLTNRGGDAAIQIPASWVTVSAAPGTAYEVMLPDSSVVRLRGNTTLEYAEDFARTRAVRLTGEAFFTVAKDAAHPFTVDAGGLVVTVLGTEFNVAAWADNEETTVTLASGSVEVAAEDGCTVGLEPMRQLVMDRNTSRFAVERVDRLDVDALRNGALTFDDMSLEEALRRAARFYGVAIDVPDGLAMGRTVRVAFDVEDRLEDVLFALRAATGVFDYEIRPDGVTVTGNR